MRSSLARRSSDSREAVNLNRAVTKLEKTDTRITKVVAHDLLVEKRWKFKAQQFVLVAGCIESCELAKLSGLANPSGLVGQGLTDHPIFLTHFSIRPGQPHHSAVASSKVLSRHIRSLGGSERL